MAGMTMFISFMRFNSIKVRLRLFALDSNNNTNGFQFHKGAIKTEYMKAARRELIRFQFHKGAIKTIIHH